MKAVHDRMCEDEPRPPRGLWDFSGGETLIIYEVATDMGIASAPEGSIQVIVREHNEAINKLYHRMDKRIDARDDEIERLTCRLAELEAKNEHYVKLLNAATALRSAEIKLTKVLTIIGEPEQEEKRNA